MKKLKKIDFSEELLSEEETMAILGGSGDGDTNYNVCVICQTCTLCTDGCTTCTGSCQTTCTNGCTVCTSGSVTDILPFRV